jgi:hypothetical protein
MTTHERVIPSTSRVGENIQHVHNLVMSDCRITTGIITDKLGISKGSVQTILKEDRSENFDSEAKITCCLLPRLDGE